MIGNLCAGCGCNLQPTDSGLCSDCEEKFTKGETSYEYNNKTSSSGSRECYTNFCSKCFIQSHPSP